MPETDAVFVPLQLFHTPRNIFFQNIDEYRGVFEQNTSDVNF